MKITDFAGGYEVKSHRAFQGGAFECDLFNEGRKILHVVNDGRGGSNRYEPVQGNVGLDFGSSLVSLRAFAAHEGFGGCKPHDMFVEALCFVKDAAEYSKRQKVSFAVSAEPLIKGLVCIDKRYFASTIALIHRVAGAVSK